MPDLQASSPSVFITGATGFIGQRLVVALLEQGYDVLAMVRPDRERDVRLPVACTQIPVDLTDIDKLAEIVDQAGAVIYCAGSVRGRNAADFSVANIKGVGAMLNALERTRNSPPMLLLSSLAASRPHLSDYASSKNAGEQLLHGKPSLPWTIMRPPAVYGPGDREMLPLLKMARRGLIAHVGPREQRLSLLHVDDLVSAIIAWLLDPHKHAAKTYGLDDGSPGGYDWAGIGEAVSKRGFRMFRVPRFLMDITARANLLLASLIGYAPMLTPGKVRELIQPEWLCDNSAFNDASGWEPRVDLKRGAEQLFSSER